MIRAITLVLFTSLFTLLTADSIKIYSSASQEELSFSKLVKELKAYDVVFFGEFHDNVELHKLEEKLFKAMLKKNKSVALSLEMFERDVQNTLDSYLNNGIEDAEFLANSRPWPNYDPDYKPLIELAKKFKAPVIAANVPRRHASGVHANGSEYMDQIPEEEKAFVAKELKVLDDEYKKRFIDTMKIGMSSGMHKKPSMNFDKIYAAQCLKDDTMAESIFNFLKTNPDSKVLHINGDFHSNSHLGTAQKLQIMNPDLKIAVLTPQLRAPDNKEAFSEKVFTSGDYILRVPVYE